MWCFMEEGVLVAKCIVYSLFCGLEAPLIPSIWSVWTSAEWKLPWCLLGPALCLPQCRSCPCTYLLEHFSLETQCLLKRGSCPHVLFPECFVICVVQDAHLSGLLASNLFWWGTFPQVSLGAYFLLLQSASYPPSWLFELLSFTVWKLPSSVAF